MSIRRKYIRELVETIILRLDIKHAPVNVDNVAKSYQISVIEKPTDDNLSGFILRKPNKSVIIGVNSNHHLNRKRFTIAHELGHYLLHKGDTIHLDNENRAIEINFRGLEASNKVNDQEKEANLFAAELLMPKSLLDKDLKHIGQIDLLNEDIILELAKKYKVSIAALTFRLYNLNYILL